MTTDCEKFAKNTEMWAVSAIDGCDSWNNRVREDVSEERATSAIGCWSSTGTVEISATSANFANHCSAHGAVATIWEG